MRELVLIYPHGKMVFYVERFFPCRLNKAGKVYRMIGQYASDADIEMLRSYLTKYLENIQAMELTQRQKEILRKRTEKNLKLLGGG